MNHFIISLYSTDQAMNGLNSICNWVTFIAFVIQTMEMIPHFANNLMLTNM